MQDTNFARPAPEESLDQLALDLQALRQHAGPVSYAEIVRRIGHQRLDRGVRDEAAFPSRSTVYNTFQTGRVRFDSSLVREIVLALGVSSVEAEEWVIRSKNVRRAHEAPLEGESSRPMAVPALTVVERSTPHPRLVKLLIAALSVVINLCGLQLAGFLQLSVYLDMVGTAIAALALGPWYGAFVAVTSSVLGGVGGDMDTLFFAPVNLLGALVWGYGVTRLRLGENLLRFVCLNVITAVACSVLAVIVLLAFFDGGNGHASQNAALSLMGLHFPQVASVSIANLTTSLIDKLLTASLALLAISVFVRLGWTTATYLPLISTPRRTPA